MTSKIVIQQPRPQVSSTVSDEWQSGICDCCQDVSNCCFAFWCCPCHACITTKAYGQGLCLPLLEIFGGCIPPIGMAMRVSMRQRYGIRGTMCKDCCLATFCIPCSWCQMAREMKTRSVPIVLIGAKST